MTSITRRLNSSLFRRRKKKYSDPSDFFLPYLSSTDTANSKHLQTEGISVSKRFSGRTGVDGDPDCEPARGANERTLASTWRRPRVSWDACLSATPEGPHPRLWRSRRNAHRQRARTHARTHEQVEESRLATRKDRGGEEGIADRGRGIRRVTRNAIFTHGMRASSRYRAPGRSAAPLPRDDVSDAARPSRRDTPHSLTARRRSRQSQGRAVRESLLSTRPRNGTRQTWHAPAMLPGRRWRRLTARRPTGGRANFERANDVPVDGLREKINGTDDLSTEKPRSSSLDVENAWEGWGTRRSGIPAGRP